MHKPSYRDPLDPVPKWEKRKPTQPSEPLSLLGDISQKSRKKVGLVSSQGGKDILQKYANLSEALISPTESFVVQKLLALPNRTQLVISCQDPQGEGFSVFADPKIEEVKKFVDEVINPEHVLYGVRQALKIQIV